MGYYKNNPGAQRGHKVVDIDVSQVVKLLNEIDIENAIPKAERKKILRNAMKITQKAVKKVIRVQFIVIPEKLFKESKYQFIVRGWGLLSVLITLNPAGAVRL